MQLQSLLFVLVQVKAIVKYGETHAENDYRTTYVITEKEQIKKSRNK